MDYLDLEPSIEAHYFKIQLDHNGKPSFVQCRAFEANLEVAVACAVTADAHELLEVNAR